MSKSARNSLSNSIKMEVDATAELDDLISMEKIDRESPEMWPAKLRGVGELIANAETVAPTTSPPAWTRGLKQEDINYMHQLAALTPTGLICEIRKLYDEAYSLGIQESKEMTRGRCLNVFQSHHQKRNNKQ